MKRESVVVACMKIILLVVCISYFWKSEFLKAESKGGESMSKLSKYEQETIINFNVAEADAVVFTRDKSVIRKLDALVTEFPEVYRCIGETDIDKTYSMPKQYVSYRRPRKISAEVRQQRMEQMKKLNGNH